MNRTNICHLPRRWQSPWTPLRLRRQSVTVGLHPYVTWRGLKARTTSHHVVGGIECSSRFGRTTCKGYFQYRHPIDTAIVEGFFVPSSSSEIGRTLSSSAAPKSQSGAPDTTDTDLDSSFGYNPGGSTITNKDTILDDIDRALGVQKPPDIEVLLTDHICNVANKSSTFVHLHLIRFGHVGIRYRTSDGMDRVMNINGDFQPRQQQRHRRDNDDPRQLPTMVNFVPPQEFIFGTDGELAQQGGVYNRPFVSVRVENVSPGATDALHAYYEALDKASRIQSQPTPPHGKGNGETNEANFQHSNHVVNNGNNQGAVRFNLVDVNLTALARLLPPPFDRIPSKIASFFQQRHEQVQVQRNEENETKNMEDPSVSESSTSSGSTGSSTFSGSFQTVNRIGHDIDNAVKDVGRAYHDVRQATFVAGNCAQWTSKGLAFCGLLRRPRIFPKAILIDLLEDEFFHGRTDNINLVVYRQVDHAAKKTDWGGPYRYIKSAYVHPLRPIRNVWYGDPEEFADVVVSVPDGTKKAIVTTQTPTKHPKKIFLVISIANAVVPAAIMVGLVDHIGPMGPVSAAAWLGLNYWLY